MSRQNPETKIQDAIRLAVQGEVKGARLFRNNVGVAVFGKRRVVYGLGVGSHDCIGWVPYTIEAADVGRKMAIFTSIEVKVPGEGMTDEQMNWHDAVMGAGGISGCAHCEYDAIEIIRRGTSWLRKK